MIPLIENNRYAIVALCKTYGVRKLAVFGSAVRGDFDPATSDVDFVLKFEDYGPGVARRFIALAGALEDLLGRRVDLVFESVVKDLISWPRSARLKRCLTMARRTPKRLLNVRGLS
jgi:predicted nucleotidyltransferase